MTTGYCNNPRSLTLRQLTSLVGNTLRLNRELQQAWVRAELSDVRSTGGHCYLELIEKNDDGTTVAKLRANIWSSTYRAVDSKFYSATGRHISSGLKVMVCGSITHHNIYGLSFNITDIDPTYTLGDIERLRREIINRLTAEGVVARNKQLPMPLNPQRIAVISAAGAAGYGDFVNQLHANTNGFVFYPHLFAAVMQGENTPASVMTALQNIEMCIDLWDCVVIIRGGGATSDLNGFDNLELARAVATFPLPVVVGIGHERDNTVLDYIAHTRCKTPTAVAEYLIESLRQALAQASALVTDIIRYGAGRIQGEQQRLSSITSMLPALASASLRTAGTHLKSIVAALPAAAANRIALAGSRLETTAATLQHAAAGRIRIESQRLQLYPQRIRESAAMTVRTQSEKINHLAGMLRVLSPEATLQRGYSITRLNGRALKDVSAIAPGDTLTTTVAGGTITSTVNNSKQNRQ